ncbi:hypothetical protein HDU97_001249 [Phlyctochytrium planicorne]|nr:hypothetical protein HDU97_001249 [Phlyctochytrium planicorne]
MLSIVILRSLILLVVAFVTVSNATGCSSKYSFKALGNPSYLHYVRSGCMGVIKSQSYTWTNNYLHFVLNKNTKVSNGEKVNFAVSGLSIYDYKGNLTPDKVDLALTPAKIVFGKTGAYSVKQIAFSTVNPDTNIPGRYLLFDVTTTFKGCTTVVPVNVTLNYQEIGIC